MRFHVNGNGEAGRCRATKGACPFGGDSGSDNHFDTMEEAQKESAKRLSDQFGSVPRRGLVKNMPDVIAEFGYDSDVNGVPTRPYSNLSPIDTRFEESSFIESAASEMYFDPSPAVSNGAGAFMAPPNEGLKPEMSNKEFNKAWGNFYASAHVNGRPVADELDEAFDNHWNQVGRKENTAQRDRNMSEQIDLRGNGVIPARIADLAKTEAKSKGMSEQEAASDILKHEYQKIHAITESRGRSVVNTVKAVEAEVMPKVMKRLSKPSLENFRAARKTTVNEFSSFNEWEKTMGAGTRQTEANVNAFYDKRHKELMSSNGEYRARFGSNIKAEVSAELPARMMAEGVRMDRSVAREVRDNYFQMRRSVVDRLKEMKALRRDFEDGRVKPSKIVGTGYRNPRKVANEYLDNQVADYERFLRSGGTTKSSLGTSGAKMAELMNGRRKLTSLS